MSRYTAGERGEDVHVPFQQRSLDEEVREAARKASDNALRDLERRAREYVEHHAA